MGFNKQAPEDYRESHRHPDKPGVYDAEWNPGTISDLIWRIEKMLLNDVIRGFPNYPMSVLDFACGTGRILSFLEKIVDKCVGIDVSSEMVEVARKRCVRSQIIEGDLTVNSNLLHCKFDLVTVFRFFLNAQDALRIEALQALHSVLRKEGILIANFHFNPLSLTGAYVRLRSFIKETQVRMISVPEAMNLLQSNGFNIEKVRGYGYLFQRRNLVHFLPLRLLIEYNLAKWNFFPYWGMYFLIVAKRL
jgi:SAM-dependent methyltransferase